LFNFEEYSPYHKVISINSMPHFILCQNYLSEYHKQIFPMLPRYYFQRRYLIPEVFGENEAFLFGNLCIRGLNLGYGIEVAEMKLLLDTNKTIAYLKILLALKKAVNRVNTPDNLQIILTCLQNITFKDVLIPLEFYAKLFETLKTDPFFKYEV